MIQRLREIKQNLNEAELGKRQLPLSIYQLLTEAADSYPNQTAIHYFFEGKNFKEKVTYTFPELLAAVTQTANMLNGLGVSPDDAVAVILPRIPEASIAVLGAGIAGQVVPIEASLPGYQIAELLQEANPKVLICTAPFPAMEVWDLLEEIRPHLKNLSFILQVDLADYLGKLKRMGVRMSMRNQGKAEKVLGQQLGDFNRSREKMPADRLNFEPVEGKVFGRFHSSGEWMKPFFREVREKEIIQLAFGVSYYTSQEILFNDLSPTLLSGLTSGLLSSCFSGKPATSGAFMGESFAGLINAFPKIGTFYFLHGAISIGNSGKDYPVIQPVYEDEGSVFIGLVTEDGEEFPLPFVQIGNQEETPEKVYNIPFTTISEKMEEHSSVKKALIVPQPDISGKWIPIAYLQLFENDQPDLRQIYDFTVEKLPDNIQAPQGIRILDQIPLTPLRTPRIYSLIKQEIENVIRRELNDLEIKSGIEEIFLENSRENGWQIFLSINISQSVSYQTIESHFSGFPLPISIKTEA